MALAAQAPQGNLASSSRLKEMIQAQETASHTGRIILGLGLLLVCARLLPARAETLRPLLAPGMMHAAAFAPLTHSLPHPWYWIMVTLVVICGPRAPEGGA